MKKIFLIGWKDVTLAFRDRAALILMLLAPFLLTLGMGFVTGAIGGSNASGFSQVPVVLVNQDEGALGERLVSLFQSSDLADLVAPSVLADPTLARQQVDQDKTGAAILIPAGFTASVQKPQGETVSIEVYTNPTRPTSSSLIQMIVAEFANQVEINRVSTAVILAQLGARGLLPPEKLAQMAGQLSASQAQNAQPQSLVPVKSVSGGSAAADFNVLAFMAPGMALMFLMYTVSHGGRTLLTERSQGTLPRLLVSPVSPAQVLAGKVFGIFLTGAAQMLILIAASSLLFRLNWGDPLAAVVLVLAAVVGAVGWGLLITALARTPGQVSAVGSAVMLTFGILGGSFINFENMPAWFRTFSRITPNAWGLDGFTILAGGGGLAEIWTLVAGLLVMGLILFGAAVWLMNRRGSGLA